MEYHEEPQSSFGWLRGKMMKMMVVVVVVVVIIIIIIILINKLQVNKINTGLHEV
jgi:cell division protein FtsL